MEIRKLLTATTLVALSISTANAALVERLGGLAYYDTEADLTWLADANAALGSDYDSLGDGRMQWATANAWAEDLNVAGVTGWRLPNTIDVGNDGETFTNIYQGVDYGWNITTHSELSNMYHNVLGNELSYYDINGNETNCYWEGHVGCLENSGPFSNLMGRYWSATEFAPDISKAWAYGIGGGNQQDLPKSHFSFAWAVHDGDVSAVPIPASIWLFGSGLLGLIGFAKRKAS